MTYSFRLLFPVLLLAACGGHTMTAAAPAAASIALPDSVVVLDGATGASVSTAELMRRVAAADFVLLGEYHDNSIDHQLRGAMISASTRQPAVVFEQFTQSNSPIPLPAAGTSREEWLDQHGFDRKGWKWPLHQPVVDAAIAHGRSLWGSGLPRDSVRPVVMKGLDAAPAWLQGLLHQSPLDSVAQAAIDKELLDGHCGKLPESMYPGMRAAQQTRDASMTQMLLTAGAAGPAWLIAGNGHVRSDMGVPRLLKRAAPAKSVLVVGFLERDTLGTMPTAAERRLYDVAVVTPPAVREDPCAGM
ncbi:MAG: ChaN family lipoprotein [Gemmatimonadales bacterium]